MSVLTAERDLYAGLWESVESYGRLAPGEQYAQVLIDYANGQGGTVLDAGCGTGKGGLVLAKAGFDVTLCDLTDAGLTDEARTLPFVSACLWHDLYPLAVNKGQWGRNAFDYTFCCDVLEHIDPAFTMLTIQRLLDVTRVALVLSVSCVADSFGVWAGRPLHLTVQEFTWWRDRLAELGRVVDARDLLHGALFVVEPKRRYAGVPA